MKAPLLAATTCSLNMGGSSTFLLNLATGLARAGQQLDIVVVGGTNEMRSDFQRIGVEPLEVPRTGRIYEDRLQLAYRRLAEERPAAVLACLGAESFEVLRLLPPSVLRLGVIQSHDPGPYTMRQFAPWIDVMIGVSRQIRDHLRAMPEFAGKRVEYIPYGIDFPAEAAAPRRANEGPLRVVYVGRLIELQKRVSRLVAVIQRLHERGAPVHFTLVGSGPEEAPMRAALAGVPSVRFTGEVTNREIPGILREQDVFLLLSDFEGLPLSVIEAMGHGVVPVVSDLESGLRDLVTEDRGYRVLPDDIAAAAEVLLRLAADRADLARRAALCQQAAHGEFTADRMAARYRALIAAPEPPPVWPASAEIRVPVGVRPPWLFRGFPRKVRRLLRRALSPAQSS